MKVNFNFGSLHRACYLLHTYTLGTSRVSMLSGPSYAAKRAEILSVLRGCKVSPAKAGTTALKNELFKQANIDTTQHCQAECDAILINAVKQEFDNSGMSSLKF